MMSTTDKWADELMSSVLDDVASASSRLIDACAYMMVLGEFAGVKHKRSQSELPKSPAAYLLSKGFDVAAPCNAVQRLELTARVCEEAARQIRMGNERIEEAGR